MNWERCGNLPYYRKTKGRNALYANPFNWSQVIVSAEREDEWKGIAKISYKKVDQYDWDALKLGVPSFVPSEDIKNVLRASHEWSVDRNKAKEVGSSSAEIMKLFNDGSQEARNYVLEGISAMIGVARGEMTTVIGIEKDSPAYKDIADLREMFDYAKKFFIAETLDKAIEEALDYLGIYEC